MTSVSSDITVLHHFFQMVQLRTKFFCFSWSSVIWNFRISNNRSTRTKIIFFYSYNCLFLAFIFSFRQNEYLLLRLYFQIIIFCCFDICFIKIFYQIIDNSFFVTYFFIESFIVHITHLFFFLFFSF